MPTFTYTGLQTSGKSISGEIEAHNKAEAIAQLSKKHVRISEIRQESGLPTFQLFNRIGIQTLCNFTKRFAAMNTAGLPLTRTLETLAKQTENKALKSILRNILADVQGGNTLANAMAKHPKAFDSLYCAMVKAGEAGGILGDILLQLADFQEKTANLRRKVKAAMTYPAILAAVALAVVIVLMTLVVPKFATMLGDLGAQLPTSTLAVMAVGNALKEWGLILFIFLGIAGIGMTVLYKQIMRFRLAIDGLKMKIPLVGDFTKKAAVSRFSRTLGALLSGGVPIIEAMTVTAGTTGNSVLEKGVIKTLEAIKQGKPIAVPLEETGVFPPIVIEMVGTGEQTGKLPQMLKIIADQYDSEVEASMGTLTAVLEPVLIVIMGLIIGAIVVAMYMPMFEIVGEMG